MSLAIPYIFAHGASPSGSYQGLKMPQATHMETVDFQSARSVDIKTFPNFALVKLGTATVSCELPGSTSLKPVRRGVIQQDLRIATVYYASEATYLDLFKRFGIHGDAETHRSFVVPSKNLIVLRLCANECPPDLEVKGECRMSRARFQEVHQSIRFGLAMIRGSSELQAIRSAKISLDRTVDVSAPSRSICRKGELPAKVSGLSGLVAADVIRIGCTNVYIISSDDFKSIAEKQQIKNSEEKSFLLASSGSSLFVPATRALTFRNEVVALEGECVLADPLHRIMLRELCTQWAREKLKDDLGDLCPLAIPPLLELISYIDGEGSPQAATSLLLECRLQTEVALSSTFHEEEEVTYAIDEIDTCLASVGVNFRLNELPTPCSAPHGKQRTKIPAHRCPDRLATIEDRKYREGSSNQRIAWAIGNDLHEARASNADQMALVTDQCMRMHPGYNQRQMNIELLENAPEWFPAGLKIKKVEFRHPSNLPQATYFQSHFEEFDFETDLSTGARFCARVAARHHSRTQARYEELPGFRVVLHSVDPVTRCPLSFELVSISVVRRGDRVQEAAVVGMPHILVDYDEPTHDLRYRYFHPALTRVGVESVPIATVGLYMAADCSAVFVRSIYGYDGGGGNRPAPPGGRNGRGGITLVDGVNDIPLAESVTNSLLDIDGDKRNEWRLARAAEEVEEFFYKNIHIPHILRRMNIAKQK